MQSSTPVKRPRASGSKALVGIVTTLVTSTVVFVAFLIAPVIVLGLALLAYWVKTSSGSRSSRPSKPVLATADTDDTTDLPAYRFGTGS
jgi:hypothetical protein